MCLEHDSLAERKVLVDWNLITGGNSLPWERVVVPGRDLLIISHNVGRSISVEVIMLSLGFSKRFWDSRRKNIFPSVWWIYGVSCAVGAIMKSAPRYSRATKASPTLPILKGNGFRGATKVVHGCGGDRNTRGGHCHRGGANKRIATGGNRGPTWHGHWGLPRCAVFSRSA